LAHDHRCSTSSLRNCQHFTTDRSSNQVIFNYDFLIIRSTHFNSDDDELLDLSQELLFQLNKMKEIYHQQTLRLEQLEDRLERLESLNDARRTQIETLERKVADFRSDKVSQSSNGLSSIDGPQPAAADESNQMINSYKLTSTMPRSCAEALSADPTLQSGHYYIDPDGTNIGDNPINVYCDMATGRLLLFAFISNSLEFITFQSFIKGRRW